MNCVANYSLQGWSKNHMLPSGWHCLNQNHLRHLRIQGLSLLSFFASMIVDKGQQDALVYDIYRTSGLFLHNESIH